MSVDTIYKVVMHPFLKESIRSLATMTELTGNAGDFFEDKKEDFRFKGYAVCSQITGNLDGVILMHHYVETAVEIGAQVYKGLVGKDAPDTKNMNQDLGNALAEWGNTIVGRATHFLAKHNLGFSFSAPEMIMNLDDMQKYLIDVNHIVTVPIHVDDVGRYFFNLLIRKANTTGALCNASASQEEAETIISPLATPLDTNAKILLVDDSSLVRKALRRHLGKLGFDHIIEAQDGTEAVSTVASENPDFVFMDIVMGEMNGDVALEKIRQTNQTVPIVMLTSVTDSDIISKCRQLGIQGFVIKPLQNDTAAALLLKCVGQAG